MNYMINKLMEKLEKKMLELRRGTTSQFNQDLADDIETTLIILSDNTKREHELRLNIGDIVQHFKRTMKDYEDKNLYTYRILNIAEHTETREKLVIYQALYSNDEMGIHYGIYARPYEMFMSEVDHTKYPNCKQKYRFDLIDNYIVNEGVK